MRPLPLFTLLGKYYFSVGVTCLQALAAFCRDDYQLIVLEDGTMGPERETQLLQALPNVRLVRRAELEAHVAPFLKNRSRSAAYMNEQVFALKLLAPAAIAGDLGGDFAFVDSDVLFFRPFNGLDRRGQANEQLVFMHEDRDSYSVPYKTRVFGANRIRLPQGANSGLLFVRNGVFDWDLIEWFLSRDAYRVYPGVIEQTAWAALAGRVQSFRFDRAQINIPNIASDVTPSLIGQHLVSGRKALAQNDEYIELVKRIVAAGGVTSLVTGQARFPGVVGALWQRALRGFSADNGAVILSSKDPSEVLLPGLRQAAAAL